MSLIPPGTSSLADIDLYTSVQVAVTSAALYDHALSLALEVELIWMKPLTLVTVLYAIERYLGDVVLLVGLFLCFPIWGSEAEGIRLFQVRAWGALVYSWATQATMQLRLYVLYQQSRRILVLLFTLFFCEIAAIAFIIWRAIGPHSTLRVITYVTSGAHTCAFGDINHDFMYIFIPFLCFEIFLFLLALRMFVDNVKRNREAEQGKGLGVNVFMEILARDGICYFCVNIVACTVVMGLWQAVTERYANLCIPFVMFLEVLVGTRLILEFRERFARSDEDRTFALGGYSSLHFREVDMRVNSTRMSVLCQVETVVVSDVRS